MAPRRARVNQGWGGAAAPLGHRCRAPPAPPLRPRLLEPIASPRVAPRARRRRRKARGL